MWTRTGFVLLLSLHAVGRPPALAGVPSANPIEVGATSEVRTDSEGDPLPVGVIARIGSRRLRHSDPADIVAFSADGRWVASYCRWESRVSVWEAASGKLRRHVHVSGVAKMAFAASGNTLAVMVAPGTFTPEILVECWDLVSGQRTLRFRDEERYAEDAVLAFSPDGSHLYFGRASLRRVSLARHRLVYHVPVGRQDGDSDAETITALAVSPDGTTLVTAEGDATVRVRDAFTGKERWRVKDLSASRLAFSADGKALAIGTAGPLEVWHLPPTASQEPGVTVDKRRLGRESTSAIAGLQFSADGKTLLCLDAEGCACLWEVASGKRSTRRKLPIHQCGAVAFDEAHRPLVLTGNESSRGLRIWHVAQGSELFPQRNLGGQITCMTFSPDGKTLATGHDDKTVRFWQSGTGKLLAHVRLPECPCQLDFSADGKALVAGGNGQWWKLLLGKRHGSGLDRPALAPVGEEGVAWRQGKVHRGRPFPWRVDLVEECTLTPDGFLMDLDRSGVRLIQISSGKKLCELPGSRYFGPALAPNRRTLAVLNDASIILADLATGQEIERWEVPRPEMVQGQPWLLPRHAFRPDGRLLALGTPRGSIFFRDLATGEQIHKLAGPDMPVALLAFSPEGRTMACAYRDATVLIWDVASVSPKRRPAATDPMDKYWLDLLMGEAPEAWKAHWAMANSTQTVSFLRERLRPVRPADLGPLAQKVRELDSPRFAMRERAMKALEAMGQPAEPGLRQALKSASSPETQRRLEQLLAKLVAAQHRQLQELRAVAILEQIASVEANQVLEAAAGGDPQAPLTIAAQAACKRLRKE